MKKFEKNQLDSLADLFCAWAGGIPETFQDINTFMHQNKLHRFLTQDNVYHIFQGRAYLSSQAEEAFYQILPVKLKFKDYELAFFPQSMHKLNYQASQQRGSYELSIPPLLKLEIYQESGKEKLAFIKENYNRLRYQNQKAKNPQSFKDAQARQKAKLTEEAKALRNEKARLRMQEYRKAHPESILRSNLKQKEKKLTDFEKLQQKIKNRQRNKKYREEHKEEIALKREAYRQSLDKEALKLKQIAYNASENRKQNSKAYYERHKQEILAKAQNNPQTKIYKQKYKAKKRFQEKTGKVIFVLFFAIKNKKSK